MSKGFKYILNLFVGMALGLTSWFVYFWGSFFLSYSLPTSFCTILGGKVVDSIIETFNEATMSYSTNCFPRELGGPYVWLIAGSLIWMFIAHKFIINRKSKKKIKKKK